MTVVKHYEFGDTRQMSRKIAVNESGRPVGESHWKSYLSDEDCELMRALYYDHGLGYKTIAKKFECPVRTARDIITYKTRAQVVVAYRRVTGETDE